MLAKGFRTRQREDVVALPGNKGLLLSLLVVVIAAAPMLHRSRSSHGAR